MSDVIMLGGHSGLSVGTRKAIGALNTAVIPHQNPPGYKNVSVTQDTSAGDVSWKLRTRVCLADRKPEVRGELLMKKNKKTHKKRKKGMEGGLLEPVVAILVQFDSL